MLSLDSGGPPDVSREEVIIGMRDDCGNGIHDLDGGVAVRTHSLLENVATVPGSLRGVSRRESHDSTA